MCHLGYVYCINIEKNLLTSISGFSKNMQMMPHHRYPDNGYGRGNGATNGNGGYVNGGANGNGRVGPNGAYQRTYSEPNGNGFESFPASSQFDMPKSSARPIPKTLRNE